MAVSSSKMFPSDEERVSRILSSISFSCFLLVADWRIRALLSSSSSGLQRGQCCIQRSKPSRVSHDLCKALLKRPAERSMLHTKVKTL